MGTDPQGLTSLPAPPGQQALRIPGLQGSREAHQFKTDRPRNRREATLRGLLARAAGALGGDIEDAIPCSQSLLGLQPWPRGTMRRDSARHESLVELCLSRGCSVEDAKDLVQEAHLRLFAYQRSAMVRDAESLLRRIVLNLSINHYHRELSRVFVFESIDKLERRGTLIDPAPGPDRTAAAEQQLDRVVGVVSAMSRRTCQIFIAQRCGYSHEELAAAFAIKPRTVEKHVALATSVLTEMMPAHFPRACDCRS